MLLDIIKEPNKALHQKSREVLPEEINDDLRKKLSDMAVTMYASAGVGLSGPQVGDFRRIFVADLSYEFGSPNGEFGQYGKKLVKIINPVILRAEGEMSGPEGCLSVPRFEQTVSRKEKIIVQYQDEWGNPTQRIFEDFLAVIIQHEIDHLDGITLLDKASPIKKKSYVKKCKK